MRSGFRRVFNRQFSTETTGKAGNIGKTKKEKSSGFWPFVGIVASSAAVIALVEDGLNSAMGIHSSTWPSVEGTITSDPIITSSGALFSRPEIGVEFEYHVEPEEDDDDDDDDDEEAETDFVCSTVYAVPRLNLRRGIVDFLIRPKLDSRPAIEIAEHFPKGSNVTVYYNPETPENACIVPGLPYPDGPLAFPVFLLGMPILMSIARSKIVLPGRFGLFVVGSFLWFSATDNFERFFFKDRNLGFVAEIDRHSASSTGPTADEEPASSPSSSLSPPPPQPPVATEASNGTEQSEDKE